MDVADGDEEADDVDRVQGEEEADDECGGLTEQRLYYFRQMHTIYTMTSDW